MDGIVKRQDDVEVYLRDCSVERAMRWVMSAAEVPLDGPKDLGGAEALYPPTGAVVFTPRIEDGPWLGVWFNTSHRPWDTDVECGRAAAAALGCVVRCDPGDSHPGGSYFLEIQGEREEVIWWDEEDRPDAEEASP